MVHLRAKISERKKKLGVGVGVDSDQIFWPHEGGHHKDKVPLWQILWSNIPDNPDNFVEGCVDIERWIFGTCLNIWHL